MSIFYITERSNPQVSARAFDERGRVLMYCYEIYNENIKDLMASRGAMTSMFLNILCCVLCSI